MYTDELVQNKTKVNFLHYVYQGLKSGKSAVLVSCNDSVVEWCSEMQCYYYTTPRLRLINIFKYYTVNNI